MKRYHVITSIFLLFLIVFCIASCSKNKEDLAGSQQNALGEASQQSSQASDQTIASADSDVSVSGVISTASAAEMDQILKAELAANEAVPSVVVTWRERALREAITQIGYHERSGNNCNKFSDYFHKPCEPWAADFISWAFDYTGRRTKHLPWSNPSSVTSIIAWANAKRGRIVSSPQRGDLFAYTNGANIGFVRTVNGRNFTSFEGNTSRPGYEGGRWVWSHTRAVQGSYYFIRVQQVDM